SRMEPPIFSLTGMDEAILTFDQAYNLTTDATIRVELSTDGGANYNIVLYEVVGPAESGNRSNFSNGTAGINQISLDLGNCIGYPNLRVRFNYIGVRNGDVWAVDNITLPEGPQDVQLIWYYDDDITDHNNSLEQI